MKEPKSKLPWKIDEPGPYMHIMINSADEWPVLDVVSMQFEDKEYTVQACNNFPKAVELLELFRTSFSAEDRRKNYLKIEEFLKSLEDEKN